MSKKKSGDIIPLNEEIPGNGVKNILAKLYRRILAKNGTDLSSFNRMLNNYCAHQERHGRKPVADQRANFRKVLLSDKMTMSTFVSVGLAILRVVKFKLAIELTFPNGQVQVHGIEVDLRDQKDEEEDEGTD